MPSRTLANTTQPQLGAQMRSHGTGRATTQPATSNGLRPIRSASRPANRLASALTMPKLTRNDRTIVLEASPNSCPAMRGTTVRSRPAMAPTIALMTTTSTNWRQLAPRPSSGNGATVRAGLAICGIAMGQRAGFVQGDNPVMVRGRGRDAFENRVHEFALAGAEQRSPESNLLQGADNRPPIKGHRCARVGGQDRRLSRQLQQPEPRSIQQLRTFAGLVWRRFEIGTPHRWQEHRVPRDARTPIAEVAAASC